MRSPLLLSKNHKSKKKPVETQQAFYGIV